MTARQNGPKLPEAAREELHRLLETLHVTRDQADYRAGRFVAVYAHPWPRAGGRFDVMLGVTLLDQPAADRGGLEVSLKAQVAGASRGPLARAAAGRPRSAAITDRRGCVRFKGLGPCTFSVGLAGGPEPRGPRLAVPMAAELRTAKGRQALGLMQHLRSDPLRFLDQMRRILPFMLPCVGISPTETDALLKHIQKEETLGLLRRKGGLREALREILDGFCIARALDVPDARLLSSPCIDNILWQVAADIATEGDVDEVKRYLRDVRRGLQEALIEQTPLEPAQIIVQSVLVQVPDLALSNRLFEKTDGIFRQLVS